MNVPQVKLIPLLEDLASSFDNSELYDLAKQEKEGKIKILEIHNTPENPGWIVVIYSVTEV